MKIGFYDSGVGGLTILKKSLKEIKGDYIYLGDIKNTPYGTKDKDVLKKIVYHNVELLKKLGCDIIVIACNTATSVAVKGLREKYNSELILIGTEPAVKVAADDKNCKRILVCATSITTKEEKLKNLIQELGIEEKTTLLPLDKLVTLAEEESINYKEAKSYIELELLKYNLEEYGHIVLGCTHFPIFKDIFQTVLPKNIKILDSSEGVINNLKNKVAMLNKGVSSSNELSLSILITKESNIFAKKVRDITELDNFYINVI